MECFSVFQHEETDSTNSLTKQILEMVIVQTVTLIINLSQLVLFGCSLYHGCKVWFDFHFDMAIMNLFFLTVFENELRDKREVCARISLTVTIVSHSQKKNFCDCKRILGVSKTLFTQQASKVPCITCSISLFANLVVITVNQMWY